MKFAKVNQKKWKQYQSYVNVLNNLILYAKLNHTRIPLSCHLLVGLYGSHKSQYLLHE